MWLRNITIQGQHFCGLAVHIQPGINTLKIIQNFCTSASLTCFQEPEGKYGDVLLRIGYLPNSEKLTIVLLKARNLVKIGPDDEKILPGTSLVSR